MKRVRRATYRPGQSKMSLSENEQYKQHLRNRFSNGNINKRNGNEEKQRDKHVDITNEIFPV